MSSEEYKQEEPQDRNNSMSAYPEGRQEDTYVKDVEESGRWGTRSRRELYMVACLVLGVIAATVVGVVLGTQDDGNNEPVGLTKVDPATGEVVSAYQLPVPPSGTPITAEAELNFLREQLAADPNLAAVAPTIPTTTAELLGKSSDAAADPYVRAASWLVTVDTTKKKEASLVRFALAHIYYSTGGETPGWTKTDNWLSPTLSVCDWHGVGCCEHREYQASLFCTNTDFDVVVELDLYNNNLVGTIPSSISLLRRLQTLFMSENKLTGTIPGVVFGSLPQFSKLYLQHNQLTGAIPASIDNNIVDTVFVQGNDLSGEWPAELCDPSLTNKGKVVHFGVDCHKVECTVSCCKNWENCFYHGKVADQPVE